MSASKKKVGLIGFSTILCLELIFPSLFVACYFRPLKVHSHCVLVRGVSMRTGPHVSRHHRISSNEPVRGAIRGPQAEVRGPIRGSADHGDGPRTDPRAEDSYCEPAWRTSSLPSWMI